MKRLNVLLIPLALVLAASPALEARGRGGFCIECKRTLADGPAVQKHISMGHHVRRR